MAIYHLSMKVVSRSAGQSAVAAAAYRAGVRLVQKVVDAATGMVRDKVHNYENKDGVSHKEIVVPEGFENAEWLKDRQELWQRVEDLEIRKDAQLARQIVIALPKELSEEENIELAVNFARGVLAKEGMIVDVAVHYDNPDNPHAHLLMTMRNLETGNDDEVVFGAKNREWNSKQKILEWRLAWEKMVNRELKVRGFDIKISAASFKDRGIDLVATKHEGNENYMKRVMRVRAHNEGARLANLQAIRENPEVLIDMLQSKKGVFNRDDIVAAFKDVLFEGFGGKLFLEEEEELVRGVEGIMNSEKLVRVSDKGFGGKAMYAGRYQVEREEKLLEAANELKSRYGHMIALPKGEKMNEGLTDQQDGVVRGVLESSDLAIVQGLPGAGKSTIAKTISKEYEKLGYRVFGTAVTAAACKNLHEITDIRVETIAHMKTKWSWLEENGKVIDFGSKDILVIDEMSMVSLSDMGYLLGKAAEKGAKVIALGDVNQFAAIKEHGAASKLVEIGDVFELNQVKRMRNPEHSKAAEMMADKRIEEAIEILDKQGVFKLSSSRVVARENLVLDYVSKYSELIGDGKGKYLGLGKKMVVLAHTNKEVGALNKEIRAQLKSLGVLEAEERQVKVGTRRMSLAVGEQVVFGKNDKDLGVINGDVGVVTDIREFEEYLGGRYADVTMKLNTGTKVTVNTKEYKDISYGYAITAYKAQGGTYEYVYMIHEKGLRYEAFNVMITRHEKGLVVYVNEEDLRIKSALQDAKRIEVVQRLVRSLSSYDNKALVVDYDFESVEAKNIQHYLSIKAEVKEEIELLQEWKKEQIKEKGFVSSISDYAGINDFMHKLRLRKSIAGTILDDFSKHERLAGVANISRSLLARHAAEKEQKVILSHFRLQDSNWREEASELTNRWLEHQEELMDTLADKELELSKMQSEHEQDKLKLGYLNHYRSAHQIYLGQIYKDPYWTVCDKWKALARKYSQHSEEKLIQVVNNKPSLLGDLRGKLGWYDADEERKEALSLAKNVGDSMSKAFINSRERDLYDTQMWQKGLEQKIEKLSFEVHDLSERLAESADHKFMDSLKRGIGLLQGKEDLNRWASLMIKSQVVSRVNIHCIVEEVFAGKVSSLYKNILRYRSEASNLHDLIVRMADWYNKESAEYPGSSLFIEYKEELEHLKKAITSEKGWQKEVEANGLQVSSFTGHIQDEKSKIINSLPFRASKENIARLAEIYLDEKIEVCEKMIELKAAYLNLQKEVRFKEEHITKLKNKREGELGSLSNIYQDSPKDVLNEFKKLSQKEGARAFEIVQEDPEVLGTFKGFGIGKIVRTMDRVRAHELSQGVSNSIENIFRLEAEIKNLETEISEGRYWDKIKDLDSKAFLLTIHKLNVGTLQSLVKLKESKFELKDLEVIESLSRKKIAYKDKLLGIKKEVSVKQQKVLSFDDVVRQLKPSDYGRLFMQYAGNIVDGKENIRRHGSSISYGSLNMNLNNGLWIRFSTGESGNIFHFIQEGAGVSKMQSLEIVADQVGCAGLNATFIKKEELQPVEKDLSKEQRLVPIEFKEELTKEMFEERFAYLCSANRLDELHRYCDYRGSVLGYAARLVDKQSGKKQVLPVAYLYDKEENKAKVALKAFSDQKMIYGLEKLQDKKTVLIVEGEKTADVAQKLFPEMNVISWLGGSNSAHKVDWSCVQNKQVVIWPDNDAAGVKAAESIRDHLLALGSSNKKIAVIDVKNLGLPNKWDLADKLPEHLSKDDIAKLVKVHDQDYNLKQIKQQAKEISKLLEEKLDKLLDLQDPLTASRHEEVQQFKHPRLNKEIFKGIVLEHVFEATLKNGCMELSDKDMGHIFRLLESDIEKIACTYELRSYAQIKQNPDTFKQYYSEKGPNNNLLLQEIKREVAYESEIRERGMRPSEKNMAEEFNRMLEQAQESHFVKEISKVNKDIAQSVAEQIADYGLKHGMHNLTTKRLEMMHDIAAEEHKHLDKAIVKELKQHKLDIDHDHFKEMNRNLGRTFRNRMLHDQLNHGHHGHDMAHDHHQQQQQQQIANRLAQEAIRHQMEEQHRIQREIQHELTMTHSIKLHH